MCIHEPNNLKKKVYVLTVFSVLYLVSAFRYGMGNDYFNYHSIFMQYRNENDFFRSMAIVTEPVFSFLNWFISRFTDDIIFINAVYSLIILIPVAYIVLKYSKCVWLSCYLYICLTFFYTTLNFTRQSMAASIILLSYYFIKEKKHWVVVLIAIFAAFFHSTAIIFIPVYLISLIRPTKYLYASLSVFALVCYFSVDILFDFFANLLATLVHPRFSEYVGSRFQQGLDWYFILIPALIFILIYMAYQTDWRKNEKNSVIYVNFSFYSLIIWFFLTKIMLIERFSMYFYIFLIFSIPSLVKYFLGNFNELVLFKNLYKHNDYNVRKSKKKPQINIKTDKKIYYGIFSVFMISCFIYHSGGMTSGGRGFHGVVPYRFGIAELQRINLELSGTDKKTLLYETMLPYEYLALLKDNDCSFIISAVHNENLNMDYPTRAVLKNFGVSYDFNDFKCSSLIVICKNGKIIYEKSSTDELEYQLSMFGKEIIISSGVENAFINVDGEQLSLNHTGLNFIVFDKSGGVIDASSIYFNEKYGLMLTKFA